MIYLVKGILETKKEKFAVIDAGGIGYKIYVSSATLEQMSSEGSEVKLYTHLHVREDALDLYGFPTQEELDFFELLLTVSGIGPKAALNILNIAPVKNLSSAIARGEVEFLTKISGIGNKIAQKIILELKDKITKLGFQTEENMTSKDHEVIDALVSLGYSQYQARAAVRELPNNITGVEKRIREALKILGK